MSKQIAMSATSAMSTSDVISTTNVMSPTKAGREVWISVCTEADLVVGSGVCALLEHAGTAEQVALFRETSEGPVYAISNHDPLGDANVLSRGIIGSIGDKLVVASPLYKQHFCLQSGQCLEEPDIRVKSWPARIQAGQVQLQTN